MKAVKCPTDELSLTNKAIVNDTDFVDPDIKYCLLFLPIALFSMLFIHLHFSDISRCQLALVSTLSLQLNARNLFHEVVLDSLLCSENGQHCRSTRTSMSSHFVSTQQVPQNAYAM